MFSTRPSAELCAAANDSGKHSPIYDKGQYEALSDDSDMTLLKEQRKRYRSGSTKRWILFCACALLLAFAVSATGYLFLRLYSIEKSVSTWADSIAITTDDGGLPMNPAVTSNYNAPTGAEFGDCGHTIEEARANGCLFDAMSWLWVAPACYHKDLIDEWWGRTEWHFFSNWTLLPEDEVSRESVEAGEHNLLYTHTKYHKIHCAYMWQKTQKTLVNHLPIDSNLHSFHHTGHCERVMLNDILHEDVDCTHSAICPTQLTPVWTTCGWW